MPLNSFKNSNMGFIENEWLISPFAVCCFWFLSKLPPAKLPGVFNLISWPICTQNWPNCPKKCQIIKIGNPPFGDNVTCLKLLFLVKNNTRNH